MKTILLLALLIPTLLSPSLADDNITNDMDLSSADNLQVGRLSSLKRSSSLDFGHDWMASPVHLPGHGRHGKVSFLSDRTFSVRNKRDQGSLDKIEELRLLHQKSTLHRRKVKSSSYSKDYSLSSSSETSSSSKQSPKLVIAE